MGQHNAKLMLSTLWCGQLTRPSGGVGARGTKIGIAAARSNRKTCPSLFDALRTVYGTKPTFRLTFDSRGDKASPMRRGTSATEGAWHRGAAPGCCHANRVATPRYPGDQPINPHSDADALGTFNIPKTWRTDRRGAARYDLVFVFDRPAGDGPIEKVSLGGQMLLAGDARRLDRTNALPNFVSGF
jgi:hypothetical protein